MKSIMTKIKNGVMDNMHKFCFALESNSSAIQNDQWFNTIRDSQGSTNQYDQRFKMISDSIQ